MTAVGRGNPTRTLEAGLPASWANRPENVQAVGGVDDGADALPEKGHYPRKRRRPPLRLLGMGVFFQIE